MIIKSKFTFIFCLLTLPHFANAGLIINEIMYDLSGSDSGREWVELKNTTSEVISIGEIRFREADVNHKLLPIGDKSSIEAGAFVVIVDSEEGFRADNPEFQGLILESSFSLSNTGETLEIYRGESVIDSISYSSAVGASGDGMSLNRIGNLFKAGSATPGRENNLVSEVKKENEQTTINENSRVVINALPQIFANAGEDRETVAGVQIAFFGRAFGTEREPLEDARYHWNMGDGTLKTGKNISHVYEYPGKYIVSLEVVSGEYSQGDMAVVDVIVPNINIASFVSGPNGFVEIRNEDNKNIDVSGLMIVSGKERYFFPKGTLIYAKSSVKFPNTNTKIFAADYPILQYENGKKIESKVSTNKVTTNTMVRNDYSENTAKISEKVLVASVSQLPNQEELDLREGAQNNNSVLSKTHLYLLLVFLLAVISIIVFYFEKRRKEEMSPFDIEAEEYQILSKNT